MSVPIEPHDDPPRRRGRRSGAPAGNAAGGDHVLIDRTARFEQAAARNAQLIRSQEDGRRSATPSPVRALLQQQRALGEVALAVAQARPLDVIYGLAAEQAARVAEFSAGRVVRFRPDRIGVVVGSFGGGSERLGSRITLDRGTVYGEVARTGRPARADRASTAQEPFGPPAVGRHRSRASVAVPIRVGGEVWGALVAVAAAAEPPQDELHERLGIFADLVGLAIANARERARLQAEASTDALTGLLNHRAFQERYEIEVDRAIRYGRALSLVLFDLDYFKTINEAYGQDAGDEALIRVSRLLSRAARPSDLIARTGGDEFALLLPETTASDALRVADRCRVSIRAAPVGAAAHLTLSAGACDLGHATTHTELMHLADAALHWAKGEGRDTAVAYTPEIVRELSDADRDIRLDRSQSLLALRSLARAVDCKNQSAQGHSERVALLARRLAAASGWATEPATRLAEAALVHDIGKVAVPDAILLKAGPLTATEYETVKSHAALSAQIAAEALSEEQTIWIRQHHERADGAGYPDGLAGDAISDGARLLALADSWDVMTTGRNYSPAKTPATALRECLSLARSQFFPDACRALTAIVADGQGNGAG